MNSEPLFASDFLFEEILHFQGGSFSAVSVCVTLGANRISIEKVLTITTESVTL